MARKLLDVWPVLSVTPTNTKGNWTREQAEEAYRELSDLIKTKLAPAYEHRIEVGFDFHEDARCEHCNGTWTAPSPDYNQGCCDLDEANSPNRLADLQSVDDDDARAEAEEADDRRRDNPLEPDFRRLGV